MNLDLKGNHVKIDLKNFDSTIHKKKVFVTINEGGALVYMHTSGGGVNVKYN